MQFNRNFLLGAATSAYQTEGNNIHSDCWLMENIEHSAYQEKSGICQDHYNRYPQDIQYLADAGLNAYRFSIEWARIQPEENTWNEEEVEHYRDVIRCCRSFNIEPLVTLHHFSSPQWAVKNGGWDNPVIVDRFASYASRLMDELGDDINYVCTINEANMRLQLASLSRDMMHRMQAAMSQEGAVQLGINLMLQQQELTRQETAKAFGVEDASQIVQFLSDTSEEGDLLVMKAHAAARDAIRKNHPHLKVGLTLSLHDMQAEEGGTELAAREWEEEFLHYLPWIKEDDFLGVQGYSRKVFGPNGAIESQDGTPKTQMGYDDYPMAIVNVTRKVAEDFPGEILITENGIATDNDGRRCEFIREALEGIHACQEDGLPVIGYLYWSLLDNFEFQKGFSKTFGLIGVERPTQERLPKPSLTFPGSFLEPEDIDIDSQAVSACLPETKSQKR